MKKFLSDVLINCDLTVSGSTSLGAATGTTVDASDNSNKIATTAWVKSLGFSTANTTYLLDVPANTTNFRLIGSDSSTDTITLSAAGASSITRVSASELRITSSDSIDYVNSVSLVGTDLTFASVGNGFAGAIDLSGITGSFNAEEVQTLYENIKNVSGGAIQKGTPLAVVPGQTSGNLSDVVPADANDPERMPAVFIANEDLADQAEGLGVVYGNITGIDTSEYDSGVTVYVAPGGGWTVTKPDGDALIQNLGIITKVHPSNGAGVVMGAGRSNDVPNIPTGYAWVGNANGVATPTLLGSLAYSSATYDNYVSWNLKTNGVQRTTVQSGGNLDIVAGSNVSVAYGAGGVVTISSTDSNTDTNNYITGLSFNTGNGILTATRQGLADLTVDLDGRYDLAGTAATEASAVNTRIDEEILPAIDAKSDSSHLHDDRYLKLSGGTLYKQTNTTGTSGTTFLTVHNNVGGDISQQQSFVDFMFTDTNANFTPQVRIGAQVGRDSDASAISKEGAGAFVVYTGDGTDESGGGSLSESFRVSYNGDATAQGIITATGGNSTKWNTAFGWGDHDGLYDTAGTGEAAATVVNTRIDEEILPALDAKLEVESDTLESVTGRGATTSNQITVGGITVSATFPYLEFVDTNSFTDTADRFRIRAGGNEGLIQWYDDSSSSFIKYNDIPTKRECYST